MSLPNPDPSLPTAINPYFQDNNFVRGDQLRNNNAQIWSNLTYLDNTITSDVATLQGEIDAINQARLGQIFPSAIQTAPNLQCFGTAVSRTTYANLFSKIGTTYGSGNGTTTFNLPNLPYSDLINFVGLNQTARTYAQIAAAYNGDVYTCIYGGDIYKQTGGAGNFVALGQTSRQWTGFATAPNGNIYACVSGGDIYKQTGGSGNFVALGQTSRTWNGMTAAPNGDIYACVFNGDIYKQTGGTGNFVALGQSSAGWTGMCSSINGDIYACIYSTGSIDVQIGGSGNFVSVSAPVKNYKQMAAAPNGDIYVTADDDIYKRINGIGTFIPINKQTLSQPWFGITIDQNSGFYTTLGQSFSVDIYKSIGIVYVISS